MEILEKIFISGGRAFKTNKHPNPIEVNTLESFDKIEITDRVLDGEGDSIIVKINDFYLPVTRISFFSFLKTVTVKNGIILEKCAIVGNYSSFTLINIESPVYANLYGEYENLKENKKTKFSKKDLDFGDVVSVLVKKNEIEELVYFGEMYYLPFTYFSKKASPFRAVMNC